jgi:hypothetical protein
MVDFINRIRNGEFNTKLPYPTRPSLLISTLEYSQARAVYDAAIIAYLADQSQLDEVFRKEAIKHAGLEGHPKAVMAYNLAYDRSSSSDFEEIYNKLELFAELLLGD